jgi:hypothetical protein
MKMNIDLKSALFGLALGAMTVFAVGAADESSSSPPHGRYQGAAGTGILLIVDTVTGQAWAIQPGSVSITGAPAGFFDIKK